MKKLYFLAATLVLSLGATAQSDTLTEFFTGTPTIYGTAGGYLAGNNEYGDLAKMQLFDATYGAPATGTINGVLLWAPIKADAGGSFDVVIYSDAAGAPGAVLGSTTIQLADVDTTIATGYSVAEGAVLYNVAAMFAVPVAIPASGSFWAGVVLPTAAGDTIALVSNTDGDFAAGATYTGEFWDDGSFHTFGDPANWGLNIALGIFPVVTSTVGLAVNSISANAFPNPASDVLNITVAEPMSTIAVVGMDGRTVISTSVSGTSTSVDVSSLVPGVYYYTIATEKGNIVRNSFVKK
jgi:hypothetical protein